MMTEFKDLAMLAVYYLDAKATESRDLMIRLTQSRGCKRDVEAYKARAAAFTECAQIVRAAQFTG